MENLTHSLMGAALAGAALRPAAPAGERRLFVIVGTVAANLPDIDVLYSAITPAPLGYLLHHRGHTHTFAGVILQTLLIAAILAVVPAARALQRSDRPRLWLLTAAAGLSHLALDWANSYGVHPFYPFDNRWRYGDALFIFEPVLWVLLGVAVAANAHTRWGRSLTIALTTLLPIVAGVAGLVPWLSIGLLALGGGALAATLARREPAVRAAAVVLLAVAFTATMSGASSAVRREVLASLGEPPHREVVDVILTPMPSAPECWGVILIERDRAKDALVLRRGSFSWAPSWRDPRSCSLAGVFAGPFASAGRTRRIAWGESLTQPLGALEDLRARDCRVDAWLRFGRAPVVEQARIYDLRFSEPPGSGFSSMSLAAEASGGHCPGFVPPWDRPRADALQ